MIDSEYFSFAVIVLAYSITLRLYLYLLLQAENEAPYTVRHDAVDLWHRTKRASEEELLTLQEMANIYTFYHRQHTALAEAVDNLADAGKRAVLFHLGAVAETNLTKLYQFFTPYIHCLPSVQPFL